VEILINFLRTHFFHNNKWLSISNESVFEELNAVNVYKFVEIKIIMSKEIFSKFIPNVKLGTRFDADGKEIDVEIREDTEAAQVRKKIFDLFLSSGYFRIMIKTLSDFDKIVGGMTWCIEACDFDVDVDLLFHENLTIGQKM
jgi:CCDC93, coiled-coil domain